MLLILNQTGGVLIMAYEKTTWKKGDVITADKLNNIENGIADVKDINVEYDSNTQSLNINIGKDE
jgi:hypothetical protein